MAPPSDTELRANRRAFLHDCDIATKAFKGADLSPGQSPIKLFEDALLSYEKAKKAYDEAVTLLCPTDDEEKIEDHQMNVAGITAKFDKLSNLHEKYKESTSADNVKTASSDQYKQLLLEESRLADMEAEQKYELEKQRRKVELQKKLAQQGYSDPSASSTPRKFIAKKEAPDNPSFIDKPANIAKPKTDTDDAMLSASSALTYLNIKRIEGIGRPFNGKYSEWRSFKREMERDLKRCNSWDEVLDILEKRCKQKTLVTMRACRDRYGDTEKAYTETMKTFEMLYGNPRLVLQELYKKITREERARWNSHSLHDLYIDIYDGALADDESDEWKTKLNGRETVELIIKRRLPERSRKRLANKLFKEDQDSCTYNQLMEFILEEIRVTTHPLFEEFVENDIGTTFKRGGRRRNDTRHEKRNVNQMGTGDESKTKESERTQKKYPCPACHNKDCSNLERCNKFKAIARSDRWDLAKTKGRCLCCLCYGHISSACKKKKRCTYCESERYHHPLLCPNNPDNDSANVHQISEKPQEKEHNASASVNSAATTVSHARYVPVTNAILRCKHSGATEKVLLMIDTGSEMCALRMSIAKRMQADGPMGKLAIGTGNGTILYDAMICDFEIKGIHGDTFHELNAVKCVDDEFTITHNNPLMHDWDYTEHPHLSGLQLPKLKSEIVELVIGTCHPMLQNLTDPIRPANGKGPVAKKSVFGYVIAGNENSCILQHCNVNRMHLMNSHCEGFVEDAVCSGDADTCKLLHKQINHHFYSEYGEDDEEDICPSVDDVSALSILEETLTEVDGKWQMSLPLKNGGDTVLPNNSSYALRRLKSLVRQLNRHPELKEFYCSKMKDLSETHLEKVGRLDLHAEDGLIWYICHFVTKQVKPRIVYDGPAEFRGCSLNMCLFDGPDIVQKLWDVLIRFREGPIAFTFDLKNMFMSVGIAPEHRDLLRIIWFADPTDMNSEFSVYRFKDLPYGLNCSSCISTFALKKTAQLNPTHACPRAVDMTDSSYYVDDCLESVHSTEDAVRTVLDHFKMIESRNFHAHKFTSNSRDVLQAIPDKYLAENMKGIDLNFESLPQQHVLGISWDPETDKMLVNVNIVQMPYTKRGLWSMISQIYDPLGFCCPFMLPGRRILQELCCTVKEWDDKVPDDVLKKWNRWISGLKKLEKISFPRCYSTLAKRKCTVYELHSFSDASTSGKGCVTYLRSLAGQDVEVSFVAGKSLVVPADTNTTVPKLELLAADLCSRQHAKARRALRLPVRREFFWCDSEVVLSWLKSTKKRHSKYISRRINNIKRRSDVGSWRHVPTEKNPGDFASRGIMPSKADPEHMWFKGPDFLWEKDESGWPSVSSNEKIATDTDGAACGDDLENYCCINHMLEEKDTFGNLRELFEKDDDPEYDFLGFENEPQSKESNPVRKMLPIPQIYRDILNQHSDAFEMCRALALRTRYVRNHWLAPAELVTENQGGLTCAELDAAMVSLARVAQEDWFTLKILQQIHELGFQKVLQKQCKGAALQKLNAVKSLLPFVDNDFVLRVGGRMQNTSYPFDAVHQIILPKRHHLTKVLILKEHENSGHQGHNNVLARLMLKFWIIHGGCSVKHYIESCLYCQEKRKRPQTQIMSPLPVCRSQQPKYAFSHTGVDLWGPLSVQLNKRSHGKRWGVMLTCLATRAVHLEIVEDLSTSGFIQSLMRFLNRRGQCTEFLYSDCGSNFTGCDSEFKEIVRILDAKRMKELGLTRNLSRNSELAERFQDIDKDKVKSALSRRHVDIVWEFNTPTASSAGGSWERLIKDSKKILTAILVKGMEGVPALNRRTPTDFELSTIITEVEAIMNNRPLTRISDNPHDYQALTPQMILTGVLDPSTPIHDFHSADEMRRSWRFSQIVAEQFWHRWLTLYLPWLQVRSKWVKQNPNVEVGDLVLCVDMKTEGRLNFPKAIVTKTFPDRYGIVRNVCIKFADGKEYERPIQKIVKLELDAEYKANEDSESDSNCLNTVDCEIIKAVAMNSKVVYKN